MANLSDLNVVIGEMFTVIGTIITNMVDLMTGDLLVLAVVGAFLGLIIGVLGLLFKYMKDAFSQSVSKTKMK